MILRAIDVTVRIAKSDEDKFSLYHTRNFKCIYVDSLSLNIYKYIKENHQASMDEVCIYVKSLYNDLTMTIEELSKDLNDLIYFLIDNSFIERTDIIEQNQAAI